MKTLILSIASLTASQSADIATSWKQPEANPILANSQGRFGPSSLAIKGGAVGMLVLAELIVAKKHPKWRKGIERVNWIMTGVTGMVAIGNVVGK